MSDTVGWRWSQRICGLGFTVVLLMFFFSFEETLFPRFLFSQGAAPRVNRVPDTESSLPGRSTSKSELGETTRQVQSSVSADQFPRRTYLKTLKPWTRYPQNKTTFWQYFRRPFFLWGFPNVVIVSTGCRQYETFASVMRLTTDSELTQRQHRQDSYTPLELRRALCPSTPSQRSSRKRRTISARHPPVSSSLLHLWATSSGGPLVSQAIT